MIILSGIPTQKLKKLWPFPGLCPNRKYGKPIWPMGEFEKSVFSNFFDKLFYIVLNNSFSLQASCGIKIGKICNTLIYIIFSHCELYFILCKSGHFIP